MIQHQYIERDSGRVFTERLWGDSVIGFLYTHARERMPILFRALISARVSSLLGLLQYDLSPFGEVSRIRDFPREYGVDLSECVESPEQLDTPRKIFERKIRYWECRPLPEDPRAVVSPADSRIICGSLSETSSLFLKEKFFQYGELLGPDKGQWLAAFHDGDFAIFRLTPEKYHYNHTPVAGRVADIYEIDGDHHSCNPGAVVSLVTPFSKNKRVVTIIDTDVPGGSHAGLVAMIEVVALLIGGIVQCYSGEKYDSPCPVTPGVFLKKGLPKSRYRPGSSTDVLLFQRGRIRFEEDLIRNMYTTGVESRFSQGFGRPLVETDVKVRSRIATVQDTR
jgi:phosphatidylserine decarboxylase